MQHCPDQNSDSFVNCPERCSRWPRGVCIVEPCYILYRLFILLWQVFILIQRKTMDYATDNSVPSRSLLIKTIGMWLFLAIADMPMVLN